MSSAVGIAPKNPDLANIDPDDIYSVTELSQNIMQVFSATPQFKAIIVALIALLVVIILLFLLRG